MKAKVIRGSGFRGALNYTFDVRETGKKAELISGNMAGNNPRELSSEFSAIRKLRPDIAKPVWHCSLSAPTGEKLTSDKWNTVANDFMKRMGFNLEANPWVAVRHSDTDYDHIHIIASRIGLDGKVWHGKWEARHAIEATQELERAHSLTLTQGMGNARAERKKLSAEEINMAVRTSVEPPRQRLQRLLDEMLMKHPTALELADRLHFAGIGVRANIATTGRMNGFSFEVDGVSFKSSDLGKRYTWANLQKLGVTYVENRDREGLEQLRSAARATTGDAEITAGNSRSTHGIEQPARSDSDRDTTSGSADNAGYDECIGDVQRDHGAPAQGFGRTDDLPARGTSETSGPANEGSRAEIRGGNGEANRNHRRILIQDQTANIGPDDREKNNVRYKRSFARDSKPNGGSSKKDTSQMETSDNVAISGSNRRTAGRNGERSWRKRFISVLATNRSENGRGYVQEDRKERNPTGEKTVEPNNRSAREINPTAYLETAGYTVKRDGNRHLSARINGEEVYRITQKPDGHWLWCDRYGNNGGDNIDLVREIEPDIGFTEAVYRLSNATSAQPSQPQAQQTQHQPPNLPATDEADRARGREYLKRRGISTDTMNHAEKGGLLRYTNGGVLFVGYDETGTPQNITRRSITPNDPIQKRDLRGSDKSFPPVLQGNRATIWIVEGGIDALALHDLAKREKRPPPTVIVSGGANVRSFLENPLIQAILRRAERVIIARENEKSIEAQARTDIGHEKQTVRVREIAGSVELWTPPEGIKDLAEMNIRADGYARTTKLTTKLTTKTTIPNEPSHDYGMEM